jgi:CheY-like chemotaxis protein
MVVILEQFQTQRSPAHSGREALNTEKTDPEILLVDDDEVILSTLAALLADLGYHVTTAEGVHQALKLILSRPFDVLLSDLHMPRPGDGLTVISAMRHANPKAVTILLTSFPEMEVSAQTIVSQADEIILKGGDVTSLAAAIDRRLAAGPFEAKAIQPVADILEASIQPTIELFLDHARRDKLLLQPDLSPAERTGHLHGLLENLVKRLRSEKPIDAPSPDPAVAAHLHGSQRRAQGYSVAMLIAESRMLQISIFEILRRNLDCINCSTLLDSLMVIADGVEAELQQTVSGYFAPTHGELPVLPPTADLSSVPSRYLSFLVPPNDAVLAGLPNSKVADRKHPLPSDVPGQSIEDSHSISPISGTEA